MRVHFGTVVRIGDYYYGSSGDFGPAFLTAIHARTGRIGWQDRTFAKANLVRIDTVILLDEDGTLALVKAARERLRIIAQARVAAGVSWTVPTLAEGRLFVRDRVNIMALEVS
jgi:hypothetical protein